MSVDLNQRNATRNQSTADFERKNIFTFGNRYSEGVFYNRNESQEFEAGTLLVRNSGNELNPEDLVPATGDTLADIVGILACDGKIAVDFDTKTNCNFCISGDIDAGLLVLPGLITLNTVVGNKLLKDILTDLGFVLNNVTENSNFDN